MNGIIILIAIFIVFGSYCLVSYPVLKKLGVDANLAMRSIKFGTSIAAIQIVFQPIFAAFDAIFFGQVLGMICSFFYVKRVLNISTGKNIAIIVLLPMVAVVIAAPILLLFFNIT